MIGFACAKLDNSSTIRRFDPSGIGSVILVNELGSYCSFPRTAKKEVLSRMFDNEDWLFDFHTTDIDGDSVAHANGSQSFEFRIGVVGIDFPLNVCVDWKSQAFEYTSRHHIDFRSIVEESMDRELLVDRDLCMSGRTRIKRMCLCRVDVHVGGWNAFGISGGSLRAHSGHCINGDATLP